MPRTPLGPKHTESLRHLLERTPLAEILRTARSHGHVIVTLPHTLSVTDALQCLADHKILSAPMVLAASIEDADSNTYLGMIDATLLLHTMVAEVRRCTANLSQDDLDNGPFLAALAAAWHNLAHRKIITLTDATAAVDVDLQFRSALAAPLSELLQRAFVPAARPPVHRVAVFDPRGRIIAVAAQSDVVRFLAAHLPALGSLGAAPLSSLGLLHTVVTVPATATAASAFHTMHAAGKSGILVVDAAGRALGNLSASDLRGAHAVQHLVASVEQYAPFSALVSLPPDATFATAVHTLATARLHHLYILDDTAAATHGAPVGTVSLTDILRLCVDHAFLRHETAAAE